jgi:hypothetical protein
VVSDGFSGFWNKNEKSCHAALKRRILLRFSWDFAKTEIKDLVKQARIGKLARCLVVEQ